MRKNNSIAKVVFFKSSWLYDWVNLFLLQMSNSNKNSASYTNSFARYCSLKNPAFWLVQRFLSHNSKAGRPSLLSHSCKKLQMNWSNFCQSSLNLIFGPFSGLFELSWDNTTFFKTQASKLWVSNFMHKIRKNWWASSEFLACEWAEERTNRAKFI